MLNKGRAGEIIDATWASVLADGKIHVTVPEGTEGAVVREYETSDGKTGSKTELVYQDLVGKVEKIDFYEGQYGKQLQITVVDGEEKPVILSLSTESNFGEDIMKKLPGLDLKKTVKFAPYSFEDEKTGKKKRGVSVMQDGDKKIENYFYDKESKENLHGYPEIPKPKKGGKPISKAEWKIYFAQARIFLVDFITEHFELDKPKDYADEQKEVDEVFASHTPKAKKVRK